VPAEEDEFKEQKTELPAAPREGDLLQFDPGVPTTMRFYVDGASLSVGADDVVRYTLVVAGEGDTRNIMYEGLRCKTKEYKTYSYGQKDGSWSKARDPQWESIRRDPPRMRLYTDFLCPLGGPIRTPKEGVGALRAGVHPQVESLRTP